MKLADKIYQYRKKMGLSQEELAERVGVTRQSVSKWEMGTSQPELDTVVQLAKTFGITVDELLVEDDEKKNGSASHQPREGNRDWMNYLPGFIRNLSRRYGWLAGVYIALSGTVTLGVGALARYLSRKMIGSFTNATSGITGMVGGYTGGFMDHYSQQMDEMMGTFFSFDPVSAIGTFMMVLGAALILMGAALALYLKRRSDG